MPRNAYLALKYLALKRTIHRFATGTDASILPIFVLTLLPVVAGIGAAIDYSRASQFRTRLQYVLDTAVIAGARDGSDAWATTAAQFFQGNAQTLGVSVNASAFNLTSTRAYAGSASASVPTDFLGMFGINSINVSVNSTAAVSNTSSNAYYCVLALNDTAQSALNLTGNSSITINAPNCVVQVNSNSRSAITTTGNAVISSSQNCFVGGVSDTGNSSVSPPPEAACSPLPDPFAAYPRPSVGSCDYTNYSLSGNKTVTLQPGVYCGGMNFSGKVDVTFNPGLYIIKDGTISESGGTFNGDGVTFFLTGAGAAVQLSGQADWHIIAPLGGPLPGFAIFLDPNGPSGAAATSSTLSGQSELYFEGVVYLPKQQVTITGSAEAIAPSPYTSYIADTLNFTGNGQLVINNNATTSVPIPTALDVQTGGKVVLAQ
jgi:hypothetical protein